MDLNSPYIIGNWKMHKNFEETKEFVQSLSEFPDLECCVVGLSVPYPMLSVATKEAKGSSILIGAQNVSEHLSGAYTGEVSPLMLVDSGAVFTLVGHSERRACFNESDEDVNHKLVQALNSGLKVVLCVGETLQQRESKQEKAVIKNQLAKGLAEVPGSVFKNIIVAYEPVWAIGTGKSATPEMAGKMHSFIREVLLTICSQSDASNIPILYGGSVKPENCEELLKEKDINGALIGGASLKIDSFVRIIELSKGL